MINPNLSQLSSNKQDNKELTILNQSSGHVFVYKLSDTQKI